MKMKKIIIAAVCGLCLMAGTVVASGLDNAVLSMAGSAADLHVRF